METILKKLEKVKTNQKSLTRKDLNILVEFFTNDLEDQKQIEKLIIRFFTLNAKDTEIVLEGIRQKMYSKNEEYGLKPVSLEIQKEINNLISKLNIYSVNQTKMPFHLSSALGKLEINDEIIKGFEPILNVFMLKEESEKSRLVCPMGEYPRYVPYMWPWKLRLSFSSQTKQRREDVGCHIEHGPFNGKIVGWWSWNPSVIAMVYLQGWGGKLAANDNHFFYKWWFMVAMGLSPYHCQLMLHSRKS